MSESFKKKKHTIVQKRSIMFTWTWALLQTEFILFIPLFHIQLCL